LAFFVHDSYEQTADLVEAVRIASSGYVGIGTKNPDQMLTVDGKIHAQEIIVNLNIPQPDYVFEPDYNLPTLDQVERHIQEKKHLPGIPLASEVAENGVSLGEMQAKLLEKIEELTLYTLQQQKEIESLRLDLAELRK